MGGGFGKYLLQQMGTWKGAAWESSVSSIPREDTYPFVWNVHSGRQHIWLIHGRNSHTYNDSWHRAGTQIYEYFNIQLKKPQEPNQKLSKSQKRKNKHRKKMPLAIIFKLVLCFPVKYGLLVLKYIYMATFKNYSF